MEMEKIFELPGGGNRLLVPRGEVLAALSAAALAARANFGGISGEIASLSGATAALGLDNQVYLSKPWIVRLCL